MSNHSWKSRRRKGLNQPLKLRMWSSSTSASLSSSTWRYWGIWCSLKSTRVSNRYRRAGGRQFQRFRIYARRIRACIQLKMNSMRWKLSWLMGSLRWRSTRRKSMCFLFAWVRETDSAKMSSKQSRSSMVVVRARDQRHLNILRPKHPA